MVDTSIMLGFSYKEQNWQNTNIRIITSPKPLRNHKPQILTLIEIKAGALLTNPKPQTEQLENAYSL